MSLDNDLDVIIFMDITKAVHYRLQSMNCLEQVLAPHVVSFGYAFKSSELRGFGAGPHGTGASKDLVGEVFLPCYRWGRSVCSGPCRMSGSIEIFMFHVQGFSLLQDEFHSIRMHLLIQGAPLASNLQIRSFPILQDQCGVVSD